ncbi:SAM-dependent methyltransferase [uncultured Winogradskyella sp.]|uniref:SAM-dependent methyltransferase n=1 Tax=uncultured Winogradskyella sp. TaxID=395353 RepID=UPI002609660C|nr:SAM-dependent methyltransferase [uncultured Winogradskyella sp.]
MKKNNLDTDYWENRYQNQNIGWDIGEISNPIKKYINQISDKSIKVLIPGAGNSYEVEYLWESGFKNTYALDIAESPLNNLKMRIPSFPNKQSLHMDFFDLSMKFDLILEQTFFCALNPIFRKNYVLKMNDLLNTNGKLSGLFFDFELTENGPPFGGDKETYYRLFKDNFKIKTLESAYNSIEGRKDKELFFIFEKK